MTHDSSNKSRTYSGPISINRKGTGFLKIENEEKDIEIEAKNLKRAFHGDEVEIILLPGKNRFGAKRGMVTRVVDRARTQFVGTAVRNNHEWFIHPDDTRMYTDIRIPNPDGALVEGHKAVVEFTGWEHEHPEADVIEILGPAGEHDVEMHAIVWEQGFYSSFPQEVEKEAEEIANGEWITDADIAERRDMRGTTTFTIDPKDAKDFDDALSVKKLENGNYEIGVHIADVAHYVRPGTKLDQEAQKRGTSVYLVDRTIPMLPEALSNGICSLVPNEDRLAFSAIFEMTQSGNVVDEWFGRTIIHSDKRFTYETAQNVLNDGEGDYIDELEILMSISRILKNNRFQAGALEFETPEIKFELDEEGRPVRAFIKERLETMKMIEDWMLLANRSVAKFVSDRLVKYPKFGRTFIYRIHDEPNAEKIEELSIFLKAIGFDLKHQGGTVENKEIRRLLKHFKDTPEEAVVTSATLRSLAKAVYHTKNIGHFSLAFKNYTHFTSPIRRYPDVMVHRILASHLTDTPLEKTILDRYANLALASSEREVEATRAERDSVKLKQTEYMSEHIGEEFDGTITGVTEWGFFVAEDNMRADGLVRVGSLGNDFYEYRKKTLSLVGQKSGISFRVGDRVQVRVTDADPESRQINYEFLKKID